MPEILIMKRNLARPTPTCLLVLLRSWRKLPAHMDSATAYMDGQKGWFKIFRETHEPILEEVTWASPSWHQQSITSFPVI